MVWISEGMAIGFLLWLSICDQREQKVPMVGLLAFLVIGVLQKILLHPKGFWLAIMVSIWILGGCVLARKASHQGMGKGDVWLMTALPLWKSGEALLWTFAIAFFGAAIYGAVRFGFRERKKRFAFIPWISGGYGVVTLLSFFWKSTI